MTLYLRDRLVEIKENFGDVLTELGLKTKVDKVGSELHVGFENEDGSSSPVRICFKGRNKNRTQAAWQAAYLEIECFTLTEFGNTGWKHWYLDAVEDFELEGTDSEIIQEIRETLKDCGAIALRENTPMHINSDEFANAYKSVVAAIGSENFEVSRDTDGCENYLFRDDNQNEFRLAFPADPFLPTSLHVDNHPVTTFRRNRPDLMRDEVAARFHPADDYR